MHGSRSLPSRRGSTVRPTGSPARPGVSRNSSGRQIDFVPKVLEQSNPGQLGSIYRAVGVSSRVSHYSPSKSQINSSPVKACGSTELRNTRLVSQKGNCTGTSPSGRRGVLLHLLPSPQKDRGLKTGVEPEFPKSFSQERKIQDGNSPSGDQGRQSERLAGVPGSEGRVPSHTNPSGRSQVPEIQTPSTGLPISGTSIWSVGCTQGVHQGIGTLGSISPNEGHSCVPVFRRLAHPSPNCTDSFSPVAATNLNPDPSRIYHKLSKVVRPSTTRPCVHWGAVSNQQEFGLLATGTTRQFVNLSQTIPGRGYGFCPRFPSPSGNDGSNDTSGTSLPPVYAPYPTVPPQFLEGSVTRSRVLDPHQSSSDASFRLVALSPECSTGTSADTTVNRHGGHHGCLFPPWLGGPSERHASSGLLGNQLGSPTYQPPGVGGGISNLVPFSQLSPGQGCPGLLRQLD